MAKNLSAFTIPFASQSFANSMDQSLRPQQLKAAGV
jgi:hypothetical protein